MSILSPVANAILNTLQAGAKGDNNADATAFLSLLGAGKADAAANLQTDQSLVDALNIKNNDPVKTSAQIPTAVFTESRQSLPQVTQPQSRSNNNDDRKPSPADSATVKKTDNAPQKSDKQSANDNASAKEVPRPVPAQAASKPVVVAEKVAKAPAKDDAVSEEDALVEKLRAKISELSDILASLAAMLGAGVSITQVTVVQTQTLTVSQENLGVNQPFIDLSDRFAQLIATITASQNVSADAGKTLGATFASFQQLIASFSADKAVGVDSGALLDHCAQCETDLSASLQNLQLVKGDTIDIGQLGDSLQKLSKWLGEVQALAAPKLSTGIAVGNDGAPVIGQAAIVAAPQTVATNIAAPVVQKETKGKESDTALNATVSSAAISAANAAPVVQPVTSQAQNVVANTVAVPTVESNAGTGANLSGNNGGGTQGGDRQAGAVPSFSGLGAANTGSAVGASSFSKMLKATTQAAPVADQVAFNIKTAVKDGASKIQIQLDPESLGKLHIKIDLSSDGKATGVVITADNKETLAMLQRDSRGLEAALADAGIKTDAGSLSFNLRGGNSGQGRDEAPKAPYGGYANLTAEEDALAPLAVVSRSYVVNTTDGLDIQI